MPWVQAYFFHLKYASSGKAFLFFKTCLQSHPTMKTFLKIVKAFLGWTSLFPVIELIMGFGKYWWRCRCPIWMVGS